MSSTPGMISSKWGLPRTTRATTRIGGPIKKKKSAKIDKSTSLKAKSRAGILLDQQVSNDPALRYSPYMFYKGEELEYTEVESWFEADVAGGKKKKKSGGTDKKAKLPDINSGAGAAKVPELKVNLKDISKEEANAAFVKVDGNGNGKLSLTELKEGIGSLWPNYNNKEAIMRSYKAADADGSGFVSKKEFHKFLMYIQAFDTAWQVFSQLDRNGDRRVSKEEFLLGAKPMQKFGIRFDDLDDTFRSMDTNGGGILLFDEVCAVFAEEAIKHIEQNIDPRVRLSSGSPGGGWNSPTLKKPKADLAELEDYDDQFTGGQVLTMVRELRTKREKFVSRRFNAVFENPIPENLTLLQQRLQAEVKNMDGNEALIRKFDLVALLKETYGFECDYLIDSFCKETSRSLNGLADSHNYVPYEKIMTLLVKFIGTSPFKEETMDACFRVFDVDNRGALNFRRIRGMKAAKKKELYGTSGSNFTMVKALLDLWSCGDSLSGGSSSSSSSTLTKNSFIEYMATQEALVHGFLEEVVRQILIKEYKYPREQLLAFPDPPTLFQCLNGAVPSYDRRSLSAIPPPAVFIPGQPYVPPQTN